MAEERPSIPQDQSPDQAKFEAADGQKQQENNSIAGDPMVASMVELGFPAAHAELAVQMTGGHSLDQAIAWLLSHQEDPELAAVPLPAELIPRGAAAEVADLAAELAAQVGQAPAWSPRAHHKMVLVVRQDLGMGRGKVAAQCAHAALGGYMRLVEAGGADHPKLRNWLNVGQTKIVVRCQSWEEMKALERKAKGAQIPTFIVHDAGRTQIAAGSATVLAVGPDTEERVNWVTGGQKLL